MDHCLRGRPGRSDGSLYSRSLAQGLHYMFLALQIQHGKSEFSFPISDELSNRPFHTRVSKQFPIQIQIIPHDVYSSKRVQCKPVLSGSKGCQMGSLGSCLKITGNAVESNSY